ncbi:hypothetical protein [Kyrpidia tusciae]|uniref:Uncharacterized protein n=1 Tax=Kyrpidia tusciae (strain DSM 2912 / NBRC 15312 / T2) TaxID=562970 RepID=D5WTZ7_KYRT2|nr:hypothetical protein [Kyrpidia tusciae]ADG05317.1 hypothetical protein Btus_0552 [Kyrpidia tusciae DSM 2912]
MQHVEVKQKTLLSAVFLSALLTLFFADSAPQRLLAAVPDRSIVAQNPVTIPYGDTAEVVLVVGNPADVAGTVRDLLVVARGDLHLQSTARAGIVVTWGGRTVIDPGARVEALYHFPTDAGWLDSVALGAALAAGLWALRLAGSVLLVVLPTLAVLILRRHMDGTVSYIEDSFGRTTLVGALGSLAVVALSAVLAATVIGAPIAALIVIAYGIAGLIGLGAVSVWAARLLQPTGDGPALSSPGLQGLIGAVLVMAFANIPAAGPVLLALAWCAGIGAVLATMTNRRVGWRRRNP